MEPTKKAEETVQTHTINYNSGTIHSTVRAEKYTGDVKKSHRIDSAITGFSLNIKDDVMLEMAELDKQNSDSFSILIRNGWEASPKMSAGSGMAVKVEKSTVAYNCTFFEGESGKAFDSKKITNRYFIALNREHLSAIFTVLRLNNDVVKAKEAANKIARTTLEL